MWVTQKESVVETWLYSTEQVTLEAITTVLYGFGLGNWAFKQNGVPFSLTKDTDWIGTTNNDGSRTVGRLYSVAAGFRKQGKNCKVAYHALGDLKDEKDQAVRGRMTVENKKGVVLVPSALEQTKKTEFSELGALYKDNYDKLPQDAATVIFDCDTSPSTDGVTITFKPSLPKLVLRRDFSLIAGRLVKVR